MKRKIIISLITIFLFFSIGSLISMLYIKDTTEELNHIIELHEVEQLRRYLVINLQKVQSSLYSVNTLFAKDLDLVVEEVTKLEESAHKCSSCHHPQRLSDRIEDVQLLIDEYVTNLSYLITTSANEERVKKLKTDVVKIGNQIIDVTGKMSHTATDTINEQRGEAIKKISQVKIILSGTLIVTLLLGIIVAIRLTKSVTRPVNILVKAARSIASRK